MTANDVRANDVHADFFTITNIAAVRGSKPVCHLHTYPDRADAPMTRA